MNPEEEKIEGKQTSPHPNLPLVHTEESFLHINQLCSFSLLMQDWGLERKEGLWIRQFQKSSHCNLTQRFQGSQWGSGTSAGHPLQRQLKSPSDHCSPGHKEKGKVALLSHKAVSDVFMSQGGKVMLRWPTSTLPKPPNVLRFTRI